MPLTEPRHYNQEEWDALSDEERENVIRQADRHRRSNRVLDLRIGDLEKRPSVNPAYVEYVYKQLRRETMMLWIALALTQISLLFHYWEAAKAVRESVDA